MFSRKVCNSVDKHTNSPGSPSRIMKTREMNIKCAFVTVLKAGKTIKQRGQKLLNKKKRKNINSFFHSLSRQPKWIKLEIACYSELCKPFEVIKQVMNKNSDETKK